MRRDEALLEEGIPEGVRGGSNEVTDVLGSPPDEVTRSPLVIHASAVDDKVMGEFHAVKRMLAYLRTLRALREETGAAYTASNWTFHLEGAAGYGDR